MQFRLSSLFGFTAISALVACAGAFAMRHWDLRSYAAGFYGAQEVPDWATGTGGDRFSEAVGALMGAIWYFGPWVALFGVAAILGGWGLKMKGVR